MVKTLARYIRQYKKASLLTPLFMVGEVLMEILIPFVTAAIIDKGLTAGNVGNVINYGVLMLVMAVFSLICGAMSGVYAARASTGFAANLRDGMYENIQKFSFSNIDKFSTAGLVTRMTTDVTNIQNAYMMLIRTAVRSPLTLICSIVMCFVISPSLSLIFVVALVVLAIVLFSIIFKTMPIFQEMFNKYDDLNASVEENVVGIRVVKSYVREDYENKKFNKASQNLYKLSVKAESWLALNNPAMMLVVYGCILALSWFGAHFIVIGSLTTGELTSLLSYVMSVLMSLMMLSMIFVQLSMSMASGRRIAQVLNEEPNLVNPENPVMTVKDGSIDFDHVGFSYKAEASEEALHDIDLHIHSGETIGVIGGTGCGKSSLVSLISRLYDVTSGDIKGGGVDVRNFDMEGLRNEVSVVLQKNVLFSGTIIDNMRWGKEDATLEEIQEACREACADEFIDQFPDGYETWIEQGGTNVSGGQRQRLCIARALLKNPKVLILDDSTSAVDTATDAKIRQAFAQHIPGTTKIIISQRVTSVMDADRILVLENGRVGGFAHHEELLKTNALYREIYEAQTQAGGDFDEQ